MIRIQNYGENVQSPHTQLWTKIFRAMAIWSYFQVAQPILDASEGRCMCWTIGAVNTLVWLAWQFTRLEPTMARHFVHSPLSGRSYTLFTSIFSHRNISRLLATSMVLSSFGAGSSAYLEDRERTSDIRESTTSYRSLSAAFTAGLFSGLTSHIAVTFPRLVSRLSASESARATTSATASSTAASTSAAVTSTAVTSTAVRSSQSVTGAVHMAFTLTVLAYPNTELAMAIAPTSPIPIQGALRAGGGLHDAPSFLRGNMG
ncbi:hypothetical protein B0H21DRAFT_696605 [Amylocystis lapponica]|nr:hypothetical protein B0H21DRAFT_696605 [Amylocystis lapponica]